MKDQDKRLDKLEQRRLPPGNLIVVGCREYFWTPEQLAAAVEDAKATAGPTDTVIAVSYGAWPPGTGD